MYELKVVRERQVPYEVPLSISTPAEVYEAFLPRAIEKDREEFLTVMLDGKNRGTSFHVVSVGSLGASLVHPREVFKAAILDNAAAIILVHNHPSGNVEPSAEDRDITERLVDAGNVLGIPVLDHVIIADGGFYSFKAKGEI